MVPPQLKILVEACERGRMQLFSAGLFEALIPHQSVSKIATNWRTGAKGPSVFSDQKVKGHSEPEKKTGQRSLGAASPKPTGESIVKHRPALPTSRAHCQEVSARNLVKVYVVRTFWTS